MVGDTAEIEVSRVFEIQFLHPTDPRDSVQTQGIPEKLESSEPRIAVPASLPACCDGQKPVVDWSQIIHRQGNPLALPSVHWTLIPALIFLLEVGHEFAIPPVVCCSPGNSYWSE